MYTPFIEEIEKLKNNKNKDLEYYKNSDLPLVMYGAGELAHYVKRFLDFHDVKIDYVTVDKEFWHSDMKFCDFNVLPWEDVLKKHSKVNVILAFKWWDGAFGKFLETKRNLVGGG